MSGGVEGAAIAAAATESGCAIAAAASALTGMRFRLHGRDPATGLDCIGLARAALAGAGVLLDVPTGYALRNRDDERWRAFFTDGPFIEVADTGQSRPGDFWLVKPAPLQAHILVRTASGLIHADAGLGRVVELPCPAGQSCSWPILSIWRYKGN